MQQSLVSSLPPSLPPSLPGPLPPHPSLLLLVKRWLLSFRSLVKIDMDSVTVVLDKDIAEEDELEASV